MSSRPPPQEAPRYMSGLYRYNLRPVVLTIAFLTAFWALFSAIGNFRSISIDRQNAPKLAVFTIVQGALYSGVLAFEVFGIVAAWTQRLPLIRTYAYLSALTAAIMIGAGLLSVVVHFVFKNDIINECTQLSENQNILVYPFGFFGPVYHDFIDEDDARRWCQGAWDHDSVSEIISLLVTILLASLFTVIAFSYYRQVLDPSSPANFSRTPRNYYGSSPSHYNPPYNASVPNLGYGYNMPYAGGPAASQQFAPPPGPPPSKPPDYQGGTLGYQAEKDENPFEDFTEVGNSSNNNHRREAV